LIDQDKFIIYLKWRKTTLFDIYDPIIASWLKLEIDGFLKHTRILNYFNEFTSKDILEEPIRIAKCKTFRFTRYERLSNG